MTLTAGSVLQQGKYVVQTVLKQTRFSTTYQAIHTYLDQPVMLQTMHDSLRDRDNFTQLSHQFITEVRYLVRHQPSAIEVLDCFVETSMPFMVLKSTSPGAIAQDALPDIDTWLKALLPDPIGPTLPNLMPDGSAVTSNPPTVVESLPADLAESVDRIGASPQTIAPSVTTEMAAPPSTDAISTTKTTAVSPLKLSQGSKILVGQAASLKRHRRLPLALLMASVIAGIGGASFGFTLRLQRPHTLNSSGGLGKTFFNREQAFPATDQWPETEIPEIPPDGVIDGMQIEQPDYRNSGSLDLPDYRGRQDFTDYAQPATETPMDDARVEPEWAPLPQEVEPMPEAVDEPFSAEPIPAAEPFKPSLDSEMGGEPPSDFGAGVEQAQPPKTNALPPLAAPIPVWPDAPTVMQ